MLRSAGLIDPVSGSRGEVESVPPQPHARPCGLPRRIASIAYDSLLVGAIWMLGGALVIVPAGDAVQPGSRLFQLYLWLLAWSYFAVCWRRGQTVGMRAWRIRLISKTGDAGWLQTLVRYAVAWVSALSLGAGFLWAYANTDRATWHDIASGTRLVVDPPAR